MSSCLECRRRPLLGWAWRGIDRCCRGWNCYMRQYYRGIRQALRVTPAVRAGIESRVWEIEDLAALVEEKELQVIEDGALKRGAYRRKNQVDYAPTFGI
jgi:hypothetical protein